jgi:hypothetical protein
MVTSLNNSTNQSARDVSYQLVHYLRKAIGPGSQASGALIDVGTIPAGALIVANGAGVYVTAEFTGTTNVLDVGYAQDSLGTADPNAYVSALVLPITTAGYFLAFDETTATTSRPRAVDVNVTATWTGTATTGSAEIVIPYIPNR